MHSWEGAWRGGGNKSKSQAPPQRQQRAGPHPRPHQTDAELLPERPPPVSTVKPRRHFGASLNGCLFFYELQCWGCRQTGYGGSYAPLCPTPQAWKQSSSSDGVAEWPG